jgi:SPASM domain peptide maturase of grasp-with-spasm system
MCDLSEHPIIDEYIEFLENKDFIFYTEDPNLFPDIEINHETSSLISNAVIDINTTMENNMERTIKTIKDLNDLNCEAVLLRILSPINEAELENILKLFDDSIITSIELHISHLITSSSESSYFENIINTYKRVQNVFIFNSEENKQMQYARVTLKYFKQNIYEFHCGLINPNHFSLSLNFFTESQHYNSCLYRKISIDENGNIYNCPYAAKSFGNIKTSNLQNIINKRKFQYLWHITKKNIDVCKDCEFRIICSDCRCYIKDTENIYSQPLFCLYNPYIAKWEGQTGYVPVEQCGVYSKEMGYIPDIEKIKQINRGIWEE